MTRMRADHWVKDHRYRRVLAESVAVMTGLSLIVVAVGGGYPYSLIFIPIYTLLGVWIATWPWVSRFGWKDDKR